MNLSSQLFADPSPYPSPNVQGENAQYAAAMLSNMASDNSEMSAVSLYFYNHLITEKCFEDYAHCFSQISIVEMHHLHLFGELALHLGTDPKLWYLEKNKMAYWSPSFNLYPVQIKALVKNSITNEKAAIKKYQDQCQWIKDPYVVAILKRIILDEELHVLIFKAMLEELENCV